MAPGVIPTHIALIADPQLIDAHTYPGRNYVLERITESVVDYYLRRNWVNINGQLDPDANIFWETCLTVAANGLTRFGRKNIIDGTRCSQNLHTSEQS